MISALVDWSPESDRPVYYPWKEMDCTVLQDHQAPCCSVARAWFVAEAASMRKVRSIRQGPRWIAEKYPWGPSSHPVSWCEALRATALDCGVHAALAREAFALSGTAAHPAQIVQSYSPSAIDHWRKRWQAAGAGLRWLGSDVIYHEVCAVRRSDESFHIWDPSAGTWLDPGRTSGYGGVVAIRIHGPVTQWGRHTLQSGNWTALSQQPG